MGSIIYIRFMWYISRIRSVSTILTMICLMSIKTRWFILQMNDSKLLTWMYLVLHIFVHMAYIIVISYQDYHTHIRIFFYYIDYEWKQLTVKWQSWWWYSHFFFVWFSITFTFSINIMLIRTITQLLYFFNCNWIFLLVYEI